MSERDKLVTPVRVTGNNNNNKEIVILLTANNNYQNATIEAFRLLSLKKQLGHTLAGLDLPMCQYLVQKYDLNCSDCQLKRCYLNPASDQIEHR